MNKINTKTHNHPVVKKTSKPAKFSNPNVLYNTNGKSYKSKSSGIGWGGEKPQNKSTKK